MNPENKYKQMPPVRVQRKRIKGFKMPPNTVYVGRPSKWGNPFLISNLISKGIPEGEALRLSLKKYKEWIDYKISDGILNPQELRGKNLSCFCHINSPCHADILLKKANL